MLLGTSTAYGKLESLLSSSCCPFTGGNKITICSWQPMPHWAALQLSTNASLAESKAESTAP